MTFEKELATYQRELPKLLEQEGRYVLIQGDTVDSVWDTRNDAMQEGYWIFGLDTPFFVQQILAYEKPVVITRHIRPVCP